MPKPDSAFVRCIYCTRGCNGDQTCTGAFNRASVYGCFLGRVLPGKEAANDKRNRK